MQRLTPEQVERYREEGFLILDGLLKGEKLARSLSVFDELVEGSRSRTEPGGGYHLTPDAEGRPIPGLLHKIQGVCVVDARVLELARDPEILDRVETLIGPEIDVFGTKFFP